MPSQLVDLGTTLISSTGLLRSFAQNQMPSLVATNRVPSSLVCAQYTPSWDTTSRMSEPTCNPPGVRHLSHDTLMPRQPLSITGLTPESCQVNRMHSFV